MIRCLAIDDEPLALRQLVSYLEKVPFFKLVGNCRNAFEAMNALEKEEVDAIFIDINMPDLNGLDFVHSLQNPPLVVFTTAYQKYAVEGYKVNAIDYLLKPFGMADVLRAADKVKRQFDLLHTASASAVDEDDAIFLKTEYKVVRIPVSQIVYVEGMAEYLRIHIASQSKPILTLLSMKKMEERLPDTDFMRIHKSYIISVHHIAEINRSRIVLDSGTDIPIGDSYKSKLNEYISKKILGK